MNATEAATVAGSGPTLDTRRSDHQHCDHQRWSYGTSELAS